MRTKYSAFVQQSKKHMSILNRRKTIQIMPALTGQTEVDYYERHQKRTTRKIYSADEKRREYK